MKKFVAFTLVLALTVFAAAALAACWQDKYETAKPSLAASDGWLLTYSDEFKDYSSIEEVYEKTAWSSVEHGPRRSGHWCDQTVELDTSESAVVVRSYLAEDHECDVCPEEGLFSGGIWTRGTFTQAFGYFEATVKVPVGSGIWSAFWLQNNGTGKIGNKGEDGTEIDIYESSFVEKNRTKTGNALHYDAYSAPWYHYGDHVADVGYDLYDGQYHTYSLLWTPEYYVFYVDGQPVWATDYAGVSKVPECMMLTVEADPGKIGPYGQKLGEFENREDGGNDFYIKSVNVWQNSDYEQYIRSDDDFADKRDIYERNAVIGGVCGGVVLAALIAGVGVAVYKRKKAKANK